MSGSNKVILYARFSPRPGEDECKSCDAQMDEMRRWASQNGKEVWGEFRDEAVSGELTAEGLPPPGLCDALSSLKRGWTLVFRDISRTCRDRALLVELERRIAQKQARVKTLHENASWDSPQDKLMYDIFAAFAEYQRAFHRELTRACVRSYQRNGKAMSAKPPYGFRIVVVDGKKILRPHEEEQRRKAEIMQLRAKGLSYDKIVKLLNERGIMQRNGKPWKKNVLYKMVKRWNSHDEPDISRFERLPFDDQGQDRVGSLLNPSVPERRLN